jgi:hypothetical protein
VTRFIAKTISRDNKKRRRIFTADKGACAFWNRFSRPGYYRQDTQASWDQKKYTQLQTVTIIASFYESEIGNGIIIAEEPVKSIQMF